MVVFDRRYEFTPVTGSTNDDLKKRCSYDSAPVLLAAGRQTGGRGRLGRSFYSVGGIYFSFNYPVTGREKDLPLLTQIAGLSVVEALDDLWGVKTQIKWPNDVLGADGGKLCGILVELTGAPGRMCAIVGIGINIKGGDAFPPRIAGMITTLEREGAAEADPELTARTAAEYCDRYFERFVKNGDDTRELIRRLNELSATVGRSVSRESEGAPVKGRAVRIDPDGALIVALPDGSERRVVCGEVAIDKADG